MPKKKHPGGRPPKPYYQEYCDLLIQHMEKGYSFESFGAHVSCCAKTLYNWCDQHPEFLQAKKEGELKARQKWEEMGMEGMNGLIPGFNATVWLFSMKNKFGYVDRIDANIKSEHTNVNVNISVEGKVNELVSALSELMDVKKESAQIRDVTPVRIKSS
jgi:hypothetical protein